MPIPVSINNVALFVSYLYQSKFAPSTISTYLSAIGYVHKILGFDDPTQSFLVQQLLQGAYKLRPSFDTRLPITIDILTRLIESVPVVVPSLYEQRLFQALFAFAFAAFARIGELVYANDVSLVNVLQLSDLSFNYNGSVVASVDVSFRCYKHHYSGAPSKISISHGDSKFSAIGLLLAFVSMRHKGVGQLFCLAHGDRLYRNYFDSILHKCLLVCNLDGRRFKGHSFRIGAASLAAEKGLSDAQIRNLGRWKSNAFRKYIRSKLD